MRNLLLKLNLCFLLAIFVHAVNAQYIQTGTTQNAAGTNIYYTAGNVGIGTTGANYPLIVLHPSYSITAAGTNNKIAAEIGSYTTYNIPAGITDAGYRMGLNINAHVRDANFLGTLTGQYGIRIQFGQYTGSGAGTITNSYGLYLQGLDNGSATITNKYGIYQSGSSFNNYFSGKLGIGITSPASPLHVYQNDASVGTGGGITIEQAGTGNAKLQLLQTGVYRWVIGIDHANGDDLILGRGDNWGTGKDLVIDKATGNVLIGKTTQTTTGVRYKLDVAGPIRANEVVINTDGADFVFDKNYKLRPLAEVENFINTNQHLPEVPSATEMQTEGVGVSELQTKLLQKVEELTLYVIQLSKQNEELKKQIEELKK